MILDKRKKVLLTTTILQWQPEVETLFNLELVELLKPIASMHNLLGLWPSQTPDIILMDTKGSTAAFHTARIIKIKDPRIKIMAVAPKFSRDIVSRIIRIGMDGLMQLPVNQQTLMHTLRAVDAGRLLFQEAIQKLVFDHFSKHYKKKMTVGGDFALTVMELKIIEQIMADHNTCRIEQELSLPKEEVQQYYRHIQTKLGFKHSADLVKYAIRKKIISV